MATRVKCPNCGRYTARKVGVFRKRLKCKYCKAKTTVKFKKVKKGIIRRRTVIVVPDYQVQGGKGWQSKYQKLRDKAMERAEYKCQKCGSTVGLEVHHKKPVSKGGKDKLSNLRVLCKACHLKAHGKKSRYA